MSPEVSAIETAPHRQPVHSRSHPLSPDPDDRSLKTMATSPNIEVSLESWQLKRKAQINRFCSSMYDDSTLKPKIKSLSPPLMRQSASSSGVKLPNDRNLIFDEWVTSKAHPVLAAHSLLPREIVNDDKAVQDMLAEAMNDVTFRSAPVNQEEEIIDRPDTPMSFTDIPAIKVDVTTRPKSSSGLSIRKWAGMFVGLGESGRRPASPSSPTSPRFKLTQERPFLAPDSSSSSQQKIIDDTHADNGIPTEPTETATSSKMSPSSSSDGSAPIDISSLKTTTKLIHDATMLHRISSAPTEEIPSLDRMRTEAIRNMTTLHSPSRLRATTLTTETHSRSGSDLTVPKPYILSRNSSSTSLASLSQRPAVPVVELDTIVPAGIQPPSVSARWDDHYKPEESGLTDRYGFIVASHRREKRHGEVIDLRESLRERTRSDEERWANVANETEDRIEELRKLGARESRVQSTNSEGVPTSIKETAQPSVVLADAKVPTSSENRPTSPLANEILVVVDEPATPSSEPVVPIPDPTPLTPSPSVSTPPIPTLPNTSDLSTIKLLLSKLNDLHDSLDRANKQRWDKWLSQSDPTDSLLTPPAGTKDRKQRLRDFRILVMGGIPVKYRSKIWAECSGATELSRPGYFEELCVLGVEGLDKLSVQQIKMDIHRTMPNNVFFGGNGPGISKLERVLIAFSRHNPTIGYCQGMNVITATLLLVHSTDEEAFWGLVAIIERILPEGYFTPDLIASRADQRVLKRLVRELCPRVHSHLQRLGVDLEAVTFNWFLSVFTDCLPAEALFRVWDVFFVEGSAYIFRVALSVIKINEKLILACKTPASVYSFMKDMTSRMLPIDKLISMSCEGLEKSVRNDLIEGMRKVEIEGLKKEMAEFYQ